MPELPEVETLRRELEKEAVGKKIKSVEVDGLKSISRHRTKKDFTGRLEGHKITRVGRRAAFLFVHLDGASPKQEGDILVVNLGPAGQLHRTKGVKDPVDKQTHAVITFTQGGQLRFTDPKDGSGELFVVEPERLREALPELATLGFDPLEDVMSWVQFGEALHARRKKLKDALTDPRFLAGIGPMYADEILFNAGLRFDRATESLTSQEVRRLYRAMTETLQEAMKHGGANPTANSDDPFGEAQDAGVLKVYDREGQSCRRCRAEIKKVKAGTRVHFLCEQCQV